MLERASGQFIVDGQVEDILGGISGAARIARISQSCRFTGQLEGESMAEFTAVLPRDGEGSFHGFQRVSGTLGEREGTFVVSVSGDFVKGQPRGAWAIVPKSGSGDFAHIRGSGTFSLPDGKPGKYQLEFDLRKPRAAKAVPVEAPEELPSPAVADPPVVIEAKPARKPRAKPVKPEAEVVIAASVKPKRARKTEPVAVEELVPAVEPIPKRTRARKAEPPTVEVAALAQVAEPPPKPKRTRKPAGAAPDVAVAAIDAAPAKPARRKKPALPAPIALPVSDPAPARKRRANAA